MSDIVATTDRLLLRKLAVTDAPFIATLANQPSFLRFIGDRGVRGLEDAREYIESGPLESYRKFGFGPYLVVRKPMTAVGLCGLYQRDFLSTPDLGFALLEEHFRRGYAGEAARRVIELACADYSVSRLAAIVNPDNERSINLLSRLGFAFERTIVVPGENDESYVFTVDLVK